MQSKRGTDFNSSSKQRRKDISINKLEEVGGKWRSYELLEKVAVRVSRLQRSAIRLKKRLQSVSRI